VAAAHHDIPELSAGDALGPYELIAPIGEGGMARVWAARIRGKPDIVALKLLLPELAENLEFRKMFFDEASIASRVRHPNVCSTFELGEQAGTLYLAMEWLDGPSLMRVLRPGREDVTECERVPIRPRIAARIVADACAGLHAAHELVGDDGRPLGVVHRDVSPHNLLMTCAGDVKITDFGVAKALGKSHMTMAGQLKGKLAYMAPEQLVGGTIDRRCDVFALGCLLYEITTGQRPFQGDHDPQVMASIMLGRYEPPSALMAEYPHALSIIVMRALSHEPENRFVSADEMGQALETYLRTSGPPVGPDQIAALVRERCGLELEARAVAMRSGKPGRAASPAPTWGPAAPKRAFESGSGAMMLERSSAASRRPVLWMAAAAVVGASLGLGVLSFVKQTRKPHRASASSSTAMTGGTTAGPARRGGSDPSPSTSVPGDASTALKDPGRVRFHVSPASAILIVDGVMLPHGTETLTRPPDGATMNVLVRAEKHEDTIVLVDAATPDELEIALLPRPGGPTSVASGSPRPRSTGGGAVAKDSGANAPASPTIDAPPNPYE
jgi:serine/threonine-protein kinase